MFILVLFDVIDNIVGMGEVVSVVLL